MLVFVCLVFVSYVCVCMSACISMSVKDRFGHLHSRRSNMPMPGTTCHIRCSGDVMSIYFHVGTLYPMCFYSLEQDNVSSIEAKKNCAWTKQIVTCLWLASLGSSTPYALRCKFCHTQTPASFSLNWVNWWTLAASAAFTFWSVGLVLPLHICTFWPLVKKLLQLLRVSVHSLFCLRHDLHKNSFHRALVQVPPCILTVLPEKAQKKTVSKVHQPMKMLMLFPSSLSLNIKYSRTRRV